MVSGSQRIAQAAQAASLNIVLHISMRILTFLLNAFILRHVTREVFGVLNVRLLLLFSTIHFLSSEPFRRAGLSNVDKHNWPRVINLLWLCIPIALGVGFICGVIWIFLLSAPDVDRVPHYVLGVIFVVLCSVIEVSAEPMFVVSQAFGYVKFKVFAEGSALGIRCILMATLITLFPEYAVLSFCFAQFIASAYFSAVFYGFFHWELTRNEEARAVLPLKSIADMIPGHLGGSFAICERVGHLASSFARQTVFKQILTEGERYVMTLFDLLTFAEQGIYDVVNNLGSLAARFIFQQVEESGYVLFAQILQRDVEASEQRFADLALSSNVLKNLLKLMVLLGGTIFVFGQSYSKLLLQLYGGASLSEGLGTVLLRCHCFYVMFIAINGVTECFTFAAMNKHQLDRHNRSLAFFSGWFLISSYVLTRIFGAPGFIFANCFNMGARIAYSLRFIRSYYQSSHAQVLEGLKPSVVVLLVWFISLIVTQFTQSMFCCDKGVISWLFHVFVGGVCFLATLLTIYRQEGELMAFIRLYWNDKRRRSSVRDGDLSAEEHRD